MPHLGVRTSSPGAILFAGVEAVATGFGAGARNGIGAAGQLGVAAATTQSRDGVDPTKVSGLDKSTKCYIVANNDSRTIGAEADFTSMDADGYTVNWTTNDANATQILYVALGV